MRRCLSKYLTKLLLTLNSELLKIKNPENVDFETFEKAYLLSLNNALAYHESPGNKILFIFHNLIMTLTYACKLTYFYLNQFMHNEIAFFNELNSRVNTVFNKCNSINRTLKLQYISMIISKILMCLLITHS